MRYTTVMSESIVEAPLASRPGRRAPSRRGFFVAAATTVGALALGRLGLRTAGAAGSVPAGHYAVSYSDAEWRKRLSPAQFAVLRHAGTEEPNSSPLEFETHAGTFVCAACSQRLFASKTKFDSGTGWPSFYEALPGGIATSIDDSMMLERRTEVHCARCGSHIGHLFDDGPKPTGLRYCMNGVAMLFERDRT